MEMTDIWLPGQSPTVPLQHWGIHLMLTGIAVKTLYGKGSHCFSGVLIPRRGEAGHVVRVTFKEMSSYESLWAAGANWQPGPCWMPMVSYCTWLFVLLFPGMVCSWVLAVCFLFPHTSAQLHCQNSIVIVIVISWVCLFWTQGLCQCLWLNFFVVFVVAVL